MRAAFEVPGVHIEARVPRSPEEAGRYVAEHIGTLLREHKPEAGEVTEFVAEADMSLRAAFDEPDGGVFVRVTTPHDEQAWSRLDAVAGLASRYGENLLN